MNSRPYEFIAQFPNMPELWEALCLADAPLKLQSVKRAYLRGGTCVLKPERSHTVTRDFFALLGVKNLTRHALPRRGVRAGTNTPTPMEHATRTPAPSEPLPCVVVIESILKVTRTGEQDSTIVLVGTGRVLTNAVGADGVGCTEFRPGGLHAPHKLPSILKVDSTWQSFKIATPVDKVLCTLFSSQDRRVFLPVCKTTGSR